MSQPPATLRPEEEEKESGLSVWVSVPSAKMATHTWYWSEPTCLGCVLSMLETKQTAAPSAEIAGYLESVLLGWLGVRLMRCSELTGVAICGWVGACG